MAMTSIGYDGTVDEFAWALLGPTVGKGYGVLGASWRVTIIANADRQLSVAPGVGYDGRIRDESDTAYIVTPEPLTSGTRWDMVVARRTWGTNLTEFKVVKGGSGRALPNREIYSTNNPVDEQPLALVRVVAQANTSGVIAEVIDLRMWHVPGAAMAVSDLVTQYATEGGEIRIGSEIWTSFLTDTGAFGGYTKASALAAPLFGWGGALVGTSPSAASHPQFFMQGGTTVTIMDATGFAQIPFPATFPNGLLTVIPVNGDQSIDRAIKSSVPVGLAGAPWTTGERHRFQVSVARPDGSSMGGLRLRVNWIALGW